MKTSPLLGSLVLTAAGLALCGCATSEHAYLRPIPVEAPTDAYTRADAACADEVKQMIASFPRDPSGRYLLVRAEEAPAGAADASIASYTRDPLLGGVVRPDYIETTGNWTPAAAGDKAARLSVQVMQEYRHGLCILARGYPAQINFLAPGGMIDVVIRPSAPQPLKRVLADLNACRTTTEGLSTERAYLWWIPTAQYWLNQIDAPDSVTSKFMECFRARGYGARAHQPGARAPTAGPSPW